MYDYARIKMADHPGDISFTDFSLDFARAFGFHLMNDLTSASGLKWWFDKVTPHGHGHFELAFKFLPGDGQRLSMTVNLKVLSDNTLVQVSLPYGGNANFSESTDDKPSVIAGLIAYRLKESFTSER